jgi:hypothetical protein
VIDDLAAFPERVRAMIARLPEPLLRVRGAGETFSFVEQAWHLADLEVEGYGARIDRLLADDNPQLADFRGDLVAAERRYNELPLEPALERFASARAANVARLRDLTPEQWERAGEQEGAGRVTLARVAEMMREHDAGHAREMETLLQTLR